MTIAWLLLSAAAVGLLGAALRQPVIVSFIAVGILAGELFDRAQARRAPGQDARPRRADTGLGQVAFTAGLR
jgi:Kef-type K+ transport system membrane component KefB